ncbi:uracil-DNA glycosylase [Piscinibacter sakaiensis]|uniref:uracil-DNA glycosylase n=1 Tax=Piscinibacter sakaiensis TaxID=1547922 RepID=UPI003AAD40E4
MAWTERQRRMLAEMGLPPWLAPAAAPDEPTDAPAPEPAAQPAAPSPTQPQAAAPVVPAPAPQAQVAPMGAPANRPAGAVAMLDWTGLRDAVAACTACGLCESRTQTVFGVGNRSAEWMIVGEAPGEQEDRQGEPFVGRSGQLLDNMLLALGLSRAEGAADRQVYIANTLKCRPPGNRNPTADELARCEPFLVRQIELIKPRIILAMGRFAVQSLLRSNEPIGRLRGRVHHYQGVPLVVTYHPAYLLRNPLDKARAWDDLCLAAETAAAAAAAAPAPG